MKIALRPLQEDDAYTSVNWRNISDIWDFTLAAGRGNVGIEDELAWIRRVAANANEKRFAIMADGVYVGNIYLTGIDRRAAEYHIVIGEKAYWGKGIAREATKQILDYAWERLALKRIDLIVHPDNKAAIALYRSLGFDTLGNDGAFIRMKLDSPFPEPEDSD